MLSLKWTEIRFSLWKTNREQLAISVTVRIHLNDSISLKPQSLINTPLLRFDKQKHSAVCRGRDCDLGYRPVDMETWTMAACPTCQFSNTSEDVKLMQRYKVSFRGFSLNLLKRYFIARCVVRYISSISNECTLNPNKYVQHFVYLPLWANFNDLTDLSYFTILHWSLGDRAVILTVYWYKK